MATKFVTGTVRLSYVNLFQPRPDLNGAEKYSVSLIIPKSDEKTIERYKKTIAEMLKSPDVVQTLGKNANPRLPLRDGDLERSNDSAYENSFFLNAKSNPDHKPVVLDKDRVPIVDPSEVYSGCYGQAILNFYAYNKGGNKGIGCSITAIRKTEDGEPLSGASFNENDFDDSLLN